MSDIDDFVLTACTAPCLIHSYALSTSQVTIIIDLDSWGLFDMPKVKDLLMPILSINGDNYPEVGELRVEGASMVTNKCEESV